MGFLKIEKSKIFAFIILILISLFLVFLVLSNMGHCESGFECPIDYGKVIPLILILLIAGWPFLLMLGVEKLIFTRVDWIHAKDIPFLITALILSVFYMYFLSCLFILIYRKLKK
jgi:hypothetical protein